MKWLIIIITASIIASAVTISYLIPAERTDFRNMEYYSRPAESSNEWVTYMLQNDSFELEEISRQKQLELENIRYSHMRMAQLKNWKGVKAEIRDMTLYDRYVKNNLASCSEC